MSFLNELKNRGVTRVIVAYVAVAWLLLQAAEILLPAYGFGDLAMRNIVAVLAAGFLVAVAFSWFYEWTRSGVVREGKLAERESASDRSRSHRRMDRFIVVVLALALAFFVVDKFLLDPARDAEREQQVAEQARNEALQTPYGDRSIAVLPFRDLSPSGDQDFLSEGVAEEVLNLLTRIPELRVAGRASSFALRDIAVDIGEMGDRLNVAYLLDGSVSRSGDRLRITAQLVDTTTETQLWSDKYDRQLDDIFAVQDDIAAQVVSELRLRLLDSPVSAKAIDPAAYERFLRARHLLNDFGDERVDETRALLNEVLAIEPDYLPALSMLSRVAWRDSKSPSAIEAELKAIAARMAAIDPDATETLQAQAEIALFMDNDLEAGLPAFQKVLDAGTTDINVLRVAVYVLTSLGQYDDAITVARQMVLRDPNCGRCLTAVGNAYRASGRYEEGAEYLSGLDLWSEPPRGYNWTLGTIMLGADRPEEALEAFEREGPYIGEVWFLLAKHDAGRREEFEEEFLALRNDPGTHPESIARVYAYLDDADNAFYWLDRMFDPASTWKRVWIVTDIYDPIKSDPRWQPMIEEHFGTAPEATETLRLDLPPGLANPE